MTASTPTTECKHNSWTRNIKEHLVNCDICGEYLLDNKPTNKEASNTMSTNTNPCMKCLGTGKYNVPLKDGSIGNCFACKGTGTKMVNDKNMTDKQVKFIRDLFRDVKQFMTEDQINNLVKAMQAHINGTETKSIKWASSAIDKLKTIKANNA